MPKFFHELTDSEFQSLKDSGTTWDQAAQLHPQPTWCGYPGALDGPMGCWSLVSRRVKAIGDCLGCEYHSNTEEIPEIHADQADVSKLSETKIFTAKLRALLGFGRDNF